MATVADNIRVYLAQKNISNKTLSEKTGIEVSALSKALNNKRKINVNEYVLIIKVLGVPVGTFLDPIAENGK